MHILHNTVMDKDNCLKPLELSRNLNKHQDISEYSRSYYINCHSPMPSIHDDSCSGAARVNVNSHQQLKADQGLHVGIRIKGVTFPVEGRKGWPVKCLIILEPEIDN